jgi:FAD/FMN-containing dehydrogenase
MSTMGTLQDLITSVGGSIHLPGADEYGRAHAPWTGTVDSKPALVVNCRSVDEVRLAVRAARLRNFPISVSGGGRDRPDHLSRQDGPAQRDGMILDLSALRRVTIDPVRQEATVEGGATAADVVRAAQQHGLVAVTGNVGSMPMAGLTLAGGYGPLTPKFGLAADNLLGAELVLEDGSVVTTDGNNNGELFWALRGGGGNFGIVVSMRIRLHPLNKVLSGIIMFPWSEARAVLRGYAALMSCAPDELSVVAGVFPTPAGHSAVLLAPVWCGEITTGRKAIAELVGLGTPLLSNVGMTTYADMLAMYDSHLANRQNHVVQTRWMDELTSDSIRPLIRAGSSRSSPGSCIALHHFHGAGTRIATPATAFALRRRHFMVEIVATWESALNDDGSAHRRWARELCATLEPMTIPGSYANLLAGEPYEQIDTAYGCNALRLRRLKRRFDPDGVFSSTLASPT